MFVAAAVIDRDPFFWGLARKVASNGAAGLELTQRRHFAAAALGCGRAAGVKVAARGRRGRRRELAEWRDEFAPPSRIGDRARGQERVAVVMRGTHEQLLGGCDFDQTPEVHHAHAIGDVAHQVQTVTDEQAGEPEAFPQIEKQVDDLRLHRKVEGGNGLVGQDELRTQRDRARDSDALPLPAGELMRVAGAVRRLQAHQRQELIDLVP